MALTTQAEIEKRLQWDITAEPDSVVTSLIAAATAHMEAEVGRKLESATYTAELHDPPGWGPIRLHNWPLTSVSAVSVEGTALTVGTDITYYPLGRVHRTTNSQDVSWNSSKRKSISVTYIGGYLSGTHTMELAHLGSICTEIVARAFRAGAASAAQPAGVGLGGIASVSLAGSDSVTYSTSGGDSFEIGGGLTRFIQILDDERRQLSRYRKILV